jgi:hypothetical protein
MAAKPKAKMGRPSRYRAEYAAQAAKLCMLGYTDDRLAEFFEVGVATVYRWKKRHPEFKAASQDGKDTKDAEVMSALWHRAVGCTVTEEKQIIRDGKVDETHSITKDVPPDTGAALFWLTNRQPHLFQKDPQQATSGDSAADALRELAERLPE